MHLAPLLVHKPGEHLGEPIVDAAKDAEHAAHEEHVVKVRDYEVGVVNEDIDRRGGHEDAAQAADDEHRHEGKRIEHGGGVLEVAAPDRTEPVEDFYRGRQGDHDG